MRVYFWPGVVVVYFGLFALLWEVICEPELIRRRSWVQLCAFALILFFFDLFTIVVVAAPAPITLYAYAMRKGNYTDGTDIGGIIWDSHFTDLRLAVTNPSNNDYQEVDLTLVPDKSVYRAVLLDKPSICDLTPVGGDGVGFAIAKESGQLTVTGTRIGSTVEMHDSMGNPYTILASDGGYRLTCSKLPAHFTVRVIFAVVALGQALIQHTNLPKSNSGQFGMSASTWKGVKSPFDMLGIRPSPDKVVANGKYTRILKSYSIASTVAVKDGD